MRVSVANIWERLLRIEAGSPAAYGLAGLCVVAATGLRAALTMGANDIVPFVTFFPAVLIATLVGGVGPGVLAALAGGVIAFLAFFDPPWNAFQRSPANVLSLSAYLGTTALIVWFSDSYRKLAMRLEQEEQHRKLIVEEMAHRLKNKVATIQAIIGFHLQDHPEIRAEVLSKLRALSGTDQLIISAQGKGALLEEIIQTELAPYGARVECAGPSLFLQPQVALTFALIIHELATNSGKYGALAFVEGRINCSWTLKDQELRLNWSEQSAPATLETPQRGGFGSQLIFRLARIYGGHCHFDYNRGGLSFDLLVILPALKADPKPPTIQAASVATA